MLKITILFLLSIGLSNVNAHAAEASEQINNQAWLDDDSEFRSLEVNEGELTFIMPVTDKSTLHSEIALTIDEQSITTGWVRLRQCYFNINPVAATDIVYQYKQIRNFIITSTQNIASARVDTQVVHLIDITAGASICVAADINVFKKTGDGIYVIDSGPYHLRFFDGYYPYHVSLTVSYPTEHIKFREISPPSQPLFRVKASGDYLTIDTWFEGVLNIRMEFESY